MSKVTDRLDNKEIIELAKRQYEQNKKASKFPANIVKFPSQGKTYPESSPLRSGELEMRYMTAYDEDILTNSTYIKNEVVFDKLLESLIITPGIDISTLIPGDKESLIISARILGYGPTYDINVLNKSDVSVPAKMDLTKLKNKPFDLTPDELGLFEYTIPSTKDKIKFKFLSADDINKINADTFVSDFLKFTICKVNDDSDTTIVQDYIHYTLRASESKLLRNYITLNSPSIDRDINVISEDGGTIPATFQFNIDLFWF
tara:strand:- start:225 stop:1004 length:780 start_codon:yes stop_codon:yes gene_type:complete